MAKADGLAREVKDDVLLVEGDGVLPHEIGVAKDLRLVIGVVVHFVALPYLTRREVVAVKGGAVRRGVPSRFDPVAVVGRGGGFLGTFGLVVFLVVAGGLEVGGVGSGGLLQDGQHGVILGVELVGMEVVLRSLGRRPGGEVAVPGLLPPRSVVDEYFFVGENVFGGNEVERETGVLDWYFIYGALKPFGGVMA